MTSDFSAISHLQILAPDWSEIRLQSPGDAAMRLGSILSGLDTVEKQAFALRGMCALLIEERELWKEFIDPEVDRPYTSMDRFLKQTLPNSWGYVRDALRAVKELRDMPFQDLLDMPRCNIETLKKVSSGVRKEAKVIQAAKTMSENQFAETMTKQYNQHIEPNTKMVLHFTASQLSEVEQALDTVARLHKEIIEEDLDTREKQLFAWAVDFNLDHASEDVNEG
jgi:hypothetical protein